MATTLAITGWSTLSSMAVGPDALARAMRDRKSGLVDVSDMFDERLPQPRAHAMVDFDVRDYLGRKRTRNLDRSTALAVSASGLALTDAGLDVTEDNRDDVGVVLGTTLGSLRATAEFDRETLVNERPYMVEPLLFPNAVMNCAASRCAIWHQLRGVNATVPSGPLSAVSVLRYGRTLIGRGHARTLLLGAVEEFSPHRAWAEHHVYASETTRAPLGEAAVVLVAEDAQEVRASGRPMDAEVLAAEFGQFEPVGRSRQAVQGLAESIRRALRAAGASPAEVVTVATGERGIPSLDEVEGAAVDEVFGAGTERLRIKELAGECDSASGALQIAAVLARHRGDPGRDGEVSVVTSCSPEGAVGAVVLRGWSRTGAR
ncbi:hypothetical protein OG562_23830 [Streptomyces sp. NBC_01275]|uniref:beta-ketoacyl synthase N-terminal-like domain-containing protein n=1 Tax=Streptomyces sp. NBC_01275 TaxID=2903807 RepID=UPI00225919D3|nr:beta-ketoacyl synthase N-terminal-like domain-containing protein [Streptomyces sp. NBC_01275]MCX4763934.1 hypothetical protein [Streptomyces sp. NBC_01275]